MQEKATSGTRKRASQVCSGRCVHGWVAGRQVGREGRKGGGREGGIRKSSHRISSNHCVVIYLCNNGGVL